jgi:hypothetical protein
VSDYTHLAASCDGHVDERERTMVLTAAERHNLLAMYAAGFDALVSALDGITSAEMEAREGSDEWSPREIIHHLGDSEMDGAVRIRMIVAERQPRLTGWDAERWIAVLYSAERPIEPSLAAVKAARDATLPLLHLMTDERWSRTGEHSEFGPMSADDWLSFYAQHAHDHAEQIRRARASA